MEKVPSFNKTQEVKEKKENKIEGRNTRNILLGMSALMFMAALEAEAKNPETIANGTRNMLEEISQLNFNKEKELGYENPDKDFSYSWGYSCKSPEDTSQVTLTVYKLGGHLFLYNFNKVGDSKEVNDVFAVDSNCDGNVDLVATRSELQDTTENYSFFDNEYLSSNIYDNYNLDSIKVNLEKEGFKVITTLENKNKLLKEVSNVVYNTNITSILNGLKEPKIPGTSNFDVKSILINNKDEKSLNKLDASIQKQKLKDQKNEQNKKNLENARARQNKW